MGRQGRAIAGIAAVLLALMGIAIWFVMSGPEPATDGTAPPERATSSPREGSGGPGAAAPADPQRGNRGTGKLTGEVRLSDDRKPVSGQVVVLVGSAGEARETTTDENGAFTFEGVDRGDSHELTVQAGEFGTVRRAGVRLGRHRKLDLGTLWLAPAARVVVEVWSAAGQQLKGARVQAYAVGNGATSFYADEAPTPVRSALSNAQGDAVFPSLAVGRWNFVAHSPGFERRATGDLTLQGGASEFRFRVTLGRALTLRGRVLDSEGEPVPRVRVVALRRTLPADARTAPLALHTRTDAAGRFEFVALPAADVVLWTGRPGQELGVAAAVRLPGVDEIDLVIPDSPTLVGTVTESEADSPVAGATVRVWLQLPIGLWIEAEGETDSHGEYEISFPAPGTVGGVHVDAPGFVPAPERTGSFGRLAEGQTARLDLSLSRGVTLTGVVSGPDGPIAGADVRVTVGKDTRSARTGRDGSYTVEGLPPGSVPLTASKWGFAPASVGSVEISTTVRAIQDVTLTRGHPVHGRVTGRDGEPLARAEVWVDGVDVGWAAVTDADGRYETPPVTPGQGMTLHAEKGGYTMGSRGISGPTGGPLQGVDFVLDPLVRVRGRVISSTGGSLAGGYVQIAGYGGGALHPIQLEWVWLTFERLALAADGTFDHRAALVDNGFVVRAVAPGHAPLTSERVALTSGGGPYDVKLFLKAGEKLTGRVVDAKGQPVRGARISIVGLNEGEGVGNANYPGAWGPPIAAITDARGNFLLQHLAPGRYAVQASAPGLKRSGEVVELPGDRSVTIRLTPEN